MATASTSAGGYLLRKTVVCLWTIVLLSFAALDCGNEAFAKTSDGKHLATLGSKIKQVFIPKKDDPISLIKKVALGAALITTMTCSTFYCGEKVVQLVIDKQAAKPRSMLDTIIRFDDDIIDKDFYYILGGSYHTGRVIKWEHPYDKITISTRDFEEKLIPISALQGKSLEWHQHEDADITFLSKNNKLKLHGRVIEVYDDGVYKVAVYFKEDKQGEIIEVSEYENHIKFIREEDIETLNAPTYY